LGKDGVGVVWQGGVLPQHRSVGANALMYWDSIRWANERGIRVLDLVGLPDPGIELFKSQFGGERCTYPVLQRMAPGWRFVQRSASRFTTFRQGITAHRRSGSRKAGDMASRQGAWTPIAAPAADH
jgi:hypothetical protein